MVTAVPRRKRLRLTIRLAVLGLVIAAAFFAYFKTDPPLENPVASWAATVALVLCPGSFLFIALGWIDAEPPTAAFNIMWLAIGLINFVLYGVIGAIIGRFLWGWD